MKKRIARKIVDGQLKPRYKRINPLLSVGMDLLTGKIGLQKIYYSIPIYRKLERGGNPVMGVEATLVETPKPHKFTSREE